MAVVRFGSHCKVKPRLASKASKVGVALVPTTFARKPIEISCISQAGRSVVSWPSWAMIWQSQPDSSRVSRWAALSKSSPGSMPPPGIL